MDSETEAPLTIVKLTATESSLPFVTKTLVIGPNLSVTLGRPGFSADPWKNEAPYNGYFATGLGRNPTSKAHAEIWADEAGKVFVKDIGSTNGTFLNGIMLNPNRKRHVRSGDIIRLGRDLRQEPNFMHLNLEERTPIMARVEY